MIQEAKICQNCNSEFKIGLEDFEFYPPKFFFQKNFSRAGAKIKS